LAAVDGAQLSVLLHLLIQAITKSTAAPLLLMLSVTVLGLSN